MLRSLFVLFFSNATAAAAIGLAAYAIHGPEAVARWLAPARLVRLILARS